MVSVWHVFTSDGIMRELNGTPYGGGVGLATDITNISSGLYYSLQIHTDKTVWATGQNGAGQLGDGTTSDTTVPSRVQSLTNVKAVHASFLGTLSLALKEDGTVWQWRKGQFDYAMPGETGLAVDGADNVLFADPRGHTIEKFVW